MNLKTTTNQYNTQQLPAGFALNDNNIEFVGNRENSSVIWLQNGTAHAFENLPSKIFKLLKDDLYECEDAVKEIKRFFKQKNIPVTLSNMVELYTYLMYGDLDNTPDVINGVLQPSENFRASANCISLAFKKKTIQINGYILNKRQLTILDGIVAGLPDKAIAHNLGITQPTLDFHKNKLFKGINVSCKIDAAVTAIRTNVTPV